MIILKQGFINLLDATFIKNLLQGLLLFFKSDVFVIFVKI